MNNGINLYGLFALALIVLKLAEIGVVASWSWAWVLAPFWVPFAGGLAFAMCVYAAKAVRKTWGRR